MRLRSCVVLAAAVLLLAPVLAAASPLEDAKRAGHVGEQADGFVGRAPGAPASAQALVDDINRQRAERYAEIAAKRSADPAAVAALAGAKLVERTPPGQWVRDASGSWKKK